VQALSISSIPVAAGFGPGLLSVAILAVNNIRDMNEDRISGKNTLIVRFGRTFGKYEYFLSVIIAIFIPFFLFIIGAEVNYSFLTILLLPLLVRPYKILTTENEPGSMNYLLGYTGKLLLIYSLIFCSGWMFPV
jgi:1,4-dihydroxy-2-naphthoate octaprenyltransferase